MGIIRRGGPRISPTQDIDNSWWYDEKPPQERPPESGRYSGATSSRGVSEIAGATVLNAAIPAVYGSCKVPGLMAFRKKASSWYFFVWLFAQGQQESVDEVWIGERKVYPVITSNGYIPLVLSAATWVGDGANIDTELGYAMSTWMSADEKTELSQYAGFSCRISKDREASSLSGSLDVTAIVGGQHVALKAGGTGASTNVGEVGYDIMTADHWKGLPAASIDGLADGTTWGDFVDYCGETMADASARYHYRGVIYNRDPEAAVDNVLSHGLSSRYYNAAGQCALVHEGPRSALSGTWSATASATLNGSGGAALSEISVGDWASFGSSYGKVESVTDDDTVVMDRLFTVSSEDMRFLTDVEIIQSDWLTQPAASEIPLAQIPEVVIVRYQGEDDKDARQYPEAADVSEDKRVEMRLDGCRSAAMAKRVSGTVQEIAELQPYTWAGQLGPAACTLEPGSIVVFATDVIAEQLGKVKKVRWNYTKGTYSVTIREMDLSAHDGGTASDPTPPVIDVADPDAPTALTMTFGERGPWDDLSMIANPDDISGWTWESGLAAAYDGTDDETELTYALAGTAWKGGYVDVTSDVDARNVLFVTQLFRWISGYDENVKVQLEYWSGADHAAATQKDIRNLTPYDNDSENLWVRTVGRFQLTSDAYHEIRYRVTNTSGAALSADAVLGVKRLRAVAWGAQGEAINTKYDHDPEHVTAKLGLHYGYSWTEHGSADDTVKLYQLRGSGTEDILLEEAEVGTDSLVWEQFQTLQRFDALWLGLGGTSDFYRGPYMLAVGPTGKTEEFPIPTQAFESDQAPVQLSEMLSFGTNGEPWFADTGTFGPYNGSQYEIPEEDWNDYWLELWVDEAGGTNYILWARQTFMDSSTSLGTSSRVEGHGESYSMAEEYAGGSSYIVRLVGKYSGLSTDLVAPGTTWTGGVATPTGTPWQQGVPLVSDGHGDPSTSDYEDNVENAAGPVVPLIEHESDSTTNDAWLKIHDLPAHDTADADEKGALFVTIRSMGATHEDARIDEFVISNEGEATAAVVRWICRSKSSGSVEFGLEIWRQADKTDEIWVRCDADPSAMAIEKIWIASNIGSGYHDFVDISSDLNTATTTAPSTGTKGFDTDGGSPDITVGTDADAIHDNVAAEINAITEKTTPISADLIIIEDSAASNAKKRVQIGNLPSGGGGSVPTTLEVYDVPYVAPAVAGVAEKIVDKSGVWRIDYAACIAAYNNDMEIKVDGVSVWGNTALPYDHLGVVWEYLGPTGDIIVPIFCSTGFEIWVKGSSTFCYFSFKAVKLGT